MADLLSTASSWLASQQKSYLSETVTYHRSAASVSLSATIGQAEFEQDNGVGSLVSTQTRDFIIDTSDLVLSGSAVLPERGDQIKQTVGSTVYVFEASSVGGEKVWRYTDRYQNRLRIHTNLIGTE